MLVCWINLDGALVKQVNNMKLQNTVMQLRKVCSHPFLFDWPVDPKSQQQVIDERLIDCSGKMMVLDRLLTELFKRKHKVLLFSQFTTMLDIIEVRPLCCSVCNFLLPAEVHRKIGLGNGVQVVAALSNRWEQSAARTAQPGGPVPERRGRPGRALPFPPQHACRGPGH